MAMTSGDAVPVRADPEVAALYNVIGANIATVVHGNAEAIHLAVVAMLAEGHVLVEDVPGVGKTTLARALAASVHGRWRRIQFTPDLLPSDVIGATVFNRELGTFDFRPGGLFTNLVLADELNRASPKTQAALLEAMEEAQVTVDATTYPLPRPFMVIATQNPFERHGTYPLPDSQLDRFLVRISLGYPGRPAEMAMLDTHGAEAPVAEPAAVAGLDDVRAMIAATRAVHVAPGVKSYILGLAEATRSSPALTLGMSPRASLALLRAARAEAAVHGRGHVLPDDVRRLAVPVLEHRLVLSPDARAAGHTRRQVVENLLASVPVPVGRD
ncbi:MAG TPA: AAA family ATPase [Acidimicrobiales bacterium]|nr:AAA family ATPase [Acidimicrobiales bacterium]